MYSQWLKTQFELSPKKSKAGLAKALGLEPPAISKILNGTRQVKAHEYAIMRRYFGLPVDGEIAVNNQNGYVIRSLKSDDEKGLRDLEIKEEDDQWIIPSRIVNQHTDAPPDKVKIFEVQEILMEPEFKRGEHVLVDLTDQTPSPPGVFLVSDGFGCLLRQCEFVPKSNPVKVRISAKDKSFQPHVLTQDDFTIIGRVIGKVQWST